MAQRTAQAISTRPPRLLIIAGATGVGKSTAAVGLAQRAGFTRVMSTDAIREIMRVSDHEHQHEALHRSSFSRGSSGEPVLDWNETCLAVEAGVTATLERARREGIDLLIEGVHIVPNARLLKAWEDAGGVALGVVMVVDEERAHQAMLKSRDAHSYRRSDRYLASFPRIRAIQAGLIERAKIANWPMVDPTRVENDVERIFTLLNRALDAHHED
jgi:2-phosphoglycerate kinase|tara:strand:- start:1258 stop:1902 length:645 start_codon:yes stop_codon:yes gene_type:complete